MAELCVVTEGTYSCGCAAPSWITHAPGCNKDCTPVHQHGGLLIPNPCARCMAELRRTEWKERIRILQESRATEQRRDSTAVEEENQLGNSRESHLPEVKNRIHQRRREPRKHHGDDQVSYTRRQPRQHDTTSDEYHNAIHSPRQGRIKIDPQCHRSEQPDPACQIANDKFNSPKDHTNEPESGGVFRNFRYLPPPKINTKAQEQINSFSFQGPSP